MNPDLLQQKFLGNTIETWLWVTGIILAGLIFKKLISIFISWSLYKIFKRYTLGASLKEFQKLLIKPFSIFITILILYFAFDRLEFPSEWNLVSSDKPGLRMILFILFEIAVVFSFTWIILRLVDFFGIILLKRAERTQTKMDDQLVPYIKSGLKIMILFMSFFFILGAVFRVNVVALIGGLGIGGLAFALAAKETVENLFGSITIFLDTPFTVGDTVKVGSIEGTVESIGLRSTRIRTLERSLVALPNKKMIDAELENVTLKTMHRAKFSIGLTYDTPAEDMRSIILDISEFLNNHSQIKENPVVKFSVFNSSSLDILVIYFVLTNEWEKYILVKEEVNYKIMEIVNRHKCNFAFPTTTVFLENLPAGQAGNKTSLL